MNPCDIDGRWKPVLKQLGVDEQSLSGKNVPCPMCGGKDRFRFTDYQHKGLYFCSGCGAGNAIQLLQGLNGWDFRQTMQKIEAVVGVAKSEPRPVRDGTTRLRQIYADLMPAGDSLPVRRYLRNRGLSPSPYLMAHPNLAYYDGPRMVARYPAMIGVVRDDNDDGVTLHCTYIDDGRKAPVESPKKVLPLKAGKTLTGSAIRLFGISDRMGACEGIETALAAQAMFGIPVWSYISDHGLAAINPPAGVKRITIFGDNDASHAGQAAAHEAAHRLAVAGYQVEVQIPTGVGTDWNDVLLANTRASA